MPLAAVSSAPVVPGKTAAVRAASAGGFRRRRGWIFFLLAAVAFAPGALTLPPVWHGALRWCLTRQAARHGYALTIARLRGGPFAATQLEGVRLRPVADGSGSDLTAARVRFALAWESWSSGSAPFLRELDLTGLRGRLELAPEPGDAPGKEAARWLPADFALQADDLRLCHGPYALALAGFSLSGRRDGAGRLDAREVRAAGPGFSMVFADWHAPTVWKDHRLAFAGLDLGGGISLTGATLDASLLGRLRLNWECSVATVGGEIRGQGSVDLARGGPALEIAATLRHTPLAPLARILGVRGPVDGQIEEASFTFRGDPENPASAQMWLSVRATGFCWGERRWQSLETQAVVVNRRVQLHRFDLRQDGNRLTLSGEYPLPADDAAGLVWTGEESWWRAAGFSGHIDARLEDLRALADLLGPDMPALAGRMSINGQLGAAPGHADIDGYLNVEGTRLTIRGAPLDALRSTLLFRRGAVEVADVQATHDADYFTAHGTFGLSGEPAARQGELRAEVRDMSVYAPALVGWPGLDDRAAAVRHLRAVLRLENGALVFERWEGEPAGFVLAR